MSYIDCGTDEINCMHREGLMGWGNTEARIMLIADNLTEDEYESAKVMGGKPVKLIETLFESFNIPIDDCYFTSVVKSPMPMTDKGVQADPTQRDTRAWAPILNSEIELIDPDIVVPLGNIALKLTYGTTGITKTRGNAIERELLGRKRIIFPTLHPELVFRQPKYTDPLISDMTNLGLVAEKGLDFLSATTVEYRYLETVEDVEAEMERLAAAEWICFDLETTGLNPFRDTSKVGCISITDRTHYGVTIPIEHPGFKWEGLSLDRVLSAVNKLLENDKVKKMGHNVKFDMLWWMVMYGVDVARVEFDPMIAHYIAVDQERGTHGLKKLAWEHTDMGGYDNALDEYKKEHGIKGNYNLIPWEILREYAAADVDCTFRLFEAFEPKINANGKFVTLLDQYMKATYAIRNLEYNGAQLDLDKLERFDEIYRARLDQLQSQLESYPEILEIEREKRELFHRRQLEMKKPKEERDPEILKWNKFKNFKFSFGSVNNLRELLFDKLKLTTPFKTEKGELSTAAESLEYMASQHPIVDMLTELRKLTKLHGTYITPAAEWPDAESLVHPTFNLTGCVAPGTRIKTNKGLVPLYKIIDCGELDGEPGNLRRIIDPEIEVFDGEVFRKPLSGYFSGNVEMVMIRVKPFREIICTLNHRLAGETGWVQADKLKRNDILTTYNDAKGTFETSKIVSIKDVYGPAFDLVMDEYDPRAYNSNYLELNSGVRINENPRNSKLIYETRSKENKNL